MQKILFFFCLFRFFLFAESIQEKTVLLEGKPLCYKVEIGEGPVSYIAYTKESPKERPLTFLFNGGPGSSSVWLHLGFCGPRRLVSREEDPSFLPPYKMVDNPETLLDVTDLVFLDPPGTGLSYELEEAYSIQGDIDVLAKAIRDYLTTHGRWNSPKYLAGESYGALRAIGLAETLQEEFWIHLNGLILISAAIDLQTLSFHPDNPLPPLLFVPTYAATAWYHGKSPHDSLEKAIEEARSFLLEHTAPFLFDLPTRLEALYPSLSSITGLDLQIVQEAKGKIDCPLFTQTLLQKEQKKIGRFDARSHGARDLGEDPSFLEIQSLFTSAMHEYLRKELHAPRFYTLFSKKVNQSWNFQDPAHFGYPSLNETLRRVLLSQPQLQIFVGCGYFDLATPFATVEYSFRHLNVPHLPPSFHYYEAGHMYYLSPKARIQAKKDLQEFYEKSMERHE